MNKFEEILSPQTKEKEKRKPYKILFTIKVLVSALLIYWILRGINFNEIAKSIENIDFLLLFTALSLHFIGFFRLFFKRRKMEITFKGTRNRGKNKLSY